MVILHLGCGDTPNQPNSAESSSTGENETRICDGSPGLRLAARLDGGGLVASELMREIGWSYLYVTGTCEAWVLELDSQDPWRDARTMQLSESTEMEIAAALHYSSVGQHLLGRGTA